MLRAEGMDHSPPHVAKYFAVKLQRDAENLYSFHSLVFRMYWADRIVDDITRRLAPKIAAGPLIVRDEKTASGQVHVGAARTVAIHGIIAQILKERGVSHTFLYEINNFDAFDALLPYIDHEVYRAHLGKPLFAVPSPQAGFGSFAEYYGGEFMGVIESLGFHPQFYYSYDTYKEGRFDEAIATALEKDELIRDIYRRVSGSDKKDSWLPIMMICEKCGKIATTKAFEWDGKEVAYVCEDTQQKSGAVGCGHHGKSSPFGGRAKLPWKVDWAAKFKVFSVDVEGEGKDLATKGGARDVANHISREVFGYEPPYDVPHEFFLIKGKKMSTSKGNAATAKEMAELLPPHIFRLALLSKEYRQAFNFEPQGDTVPQLFDLYDALAEKKWSGVADDFTRLFDLAHTEGAADARLKERFLPRFSHAVFWMQMPHLRLEEEAEKEKGGFLKKEDLQELHERADYARRWISGYAPEKYVYELQEKIPDAAKRLSPKQKEALQKLLEFVESPGYGRDAFNAGRILHERLHAIKNEIDVKPADIFSAIYLVFLGKPYGPKAGWFLSFVKRDFLLKRLSEVINS